MRYKQTYTIELTDKEQHIDRSSEIHKTLREEGMFKDTDIKVEIQREDKED